MNALNACSDSRTSVTCKPSSANPDTWSLAPSGTSRSQPTFSRAWSYSSGVASRQITGDPVHARGFFSRHPATVRNDISA